MNKLIRTGILSLRLPIVILTAVILGTGCASITPTHEKVEGFKIYDIQTPSTSTLTLQLSANLKEVT